MIPRVSLSDSASFPPYHHDHQSFQSPMDPAAVDFRAFYPYTPNEVKHRKRTTSAQLKILEGIFRRDTKPNAALRSELAVQLDMTARGVQVWFQNRRAKEKSKAAKAAKSVNSPQDEEDSDLQQIMQPADLGPSSRTSSPGRPSPTELDSSPESWQGSPAVTSPVAHDLHLLRRGSLPVDVFDNHSFRPSLAEQMDPFARRRSVDANLHRLASNPYAHLARAKNGTIVGSRISRLSQNGHYSSFRPSLPNIATMPDNSYSYNQQQMVDSPSHSPHPYYAMRNSLPDNNLYAFSSRTMSSPIPGPLPTPDYSFGAASSNNALPTRDGEHGSPDSFNQYRFGRDDRDDDERTSASYDDFSRFGSLASISSSTSAYYSDVGSVSDMANRQSDQCTQNQFLGLMSNLGVGSIPNSVDGVHSATNTSSHDDSVATNTYPSPSSTVSPGNGSPIVSDPALASISSSSELAFALQGKHDVLDVNVRYGNAADPPVVDQVASSIADGSANESPFFYIPGQSYTSNPSGPNMPLEFPDKYDYHPTGVPGDAFNGTDFSFPHSDPVFYSDGTIDHTSLSPPMEYCQPTSYTFGEVPDTTNTDYPTR